MFNSAKYSPYVLILDNAPKADHEVLPVTGEGHDGHRVGVLGLAGGGGGAGPEAGHVPAAAPDGDGEVIE